MTESENTHIRVYCNSETNAGATICKVNTAIIHDSSEAERFLSNHLGASPATAESDTSAPTLPVRISKTE